MVSSGIFTILLITIDPNEFSFKVRLPAVSPKMCSPFSVKSPWLLSQQFQQLVHYSLSDLSLGDIISTVCLYAVQLEVGLAKTHKFKWSPVMLKERTYVNSFGWVFRLDLIAL